MSKLLLLIPLILLVASCSSEEKVIGGVTSPWEVLLVKETPAPALSVLSLPQNIVKNEDIYFEKNGVHLSSAPARIADFRNYLYLFFPEEFKIEIVEKNTFKLVKTLDFSAGNLKPSDICFPNATDAYIVHGNDSLVSLLDMTNFEIARAIPVGKFPRDIACSGNQIYVTNFGDNTVSVIDSRTHKQEAVIPVAPNPMFVEANPSGEYMIVVSAGKGKINPEEQKTAAIVSFINIIDREVESTLEIGVGVQKAIDQLPLGLAVSQKEWAFVPTEKALFRVDLKNKNKVFLVVTKKFNSVGYNFRRSELLMFQNTEGSSILEIGNQTTGRSEAKFDLPADVKTILPI